MGDEKRINGVQKFMDGEYTPQEVHRAIAWGGRKCDACKVGWQPSACASSPSTRKRSSGRPSS